MINFRLTSTYANGLVSTDSSFFIINACPEYEWMLGKEIDIVLHLLASKKQFIDIQLIGE